MTGSAPHGGGGNGLPRWTEMRTTRSLARWAAFAGAVIVLLAAVGGMLLLQRRSDQARQAETALARLEGDAQREFGLGWDAVGQQRFRPGYWQDMEAIRAHIEAKLDALARTTDLDGATADVRAAYTAFRADEQTALDLLAAGRFDEARRVQDEETEPAFHQLDAAVSAASAEYAAKAERANRLMKLGSIATMLGAAGAMGLLFWQIERTQRRTALAAMEQALLGQSEARFRALVQNASDIIVVLDREAQIRYVSPSVERVLGHATAALIGQSIIPFVHPDDIEAAETGFANTLSFAGEHLPIDVRLRHADGSWRTVEARGTNLLDDPDLDGIVINVRDVTERMEAVAALQASEARLQAIVNTSPDMIAILDAEGRHRFVNAAYQTVLGYRPEQVIGRPSFAHIRPDDLATMMADRTTPATGDVFDLARSARAPTVTFRAPHADGHWVPLEARGQVLRDAEGRPEGMLVITRDITARIEAEAARRSAEEQLAHQAFYDPLTDLPNRALFMSRLEHALAADGRAPAVAVLFLDLDGFKLINDSLGHGAGDEVLVAVGRRLVRCLRPSDTLARFGGDEFTVLLTDVDGPEQALGVAERLLESLQAPVTLAQRRLFITGSVGVVFNTGAAQPVELLRQADIALYQAKGAGKNRAVLFDSEMNEQVLHRLELETDLRGAVDRGEMQLHYQPEVDLRSGAIVGVEALLRWYHPRRGPIPPSLFIPIAEDTGLILALGAWVLEQACRQGAAWQALLPDGPPLVVSVNLSARQVTQPDLVPLVTRVLADTKLPPGCLRLEITESVLVEDLEATAPTLQTLRGLGVRLAIDDFGTGYSSLSYLRRLPVDMVKVDRSFVAEVGDDMSALAIVRAVSSLAHALGMSVSAEGIETADQLARVQTLGCDFGQGFYFAAPLPPEQIATLLEQRTALPAVATR
jgi:diguanylate cyclase (GGDEF)-like protein/PAS domain S-box-containing protein